MISKKSKSLNHGSWKLKDLRMEKDVIVENSEHTILG